MSLATATRAPAPLARVGVRGARSSAPSRAIAPRRSRPAPPGLRQRSATRDWVRARPPAPLPPVRATNKFDSSEVTIEGLTPLDQICDDFVCKSSPAVEGSLRQIATDYVALRETKRSLAPYAGDVAFDDGARKFVGREKFESYAYVRENVANARCAVESMRMEGLDRAIIRWRLEGDVPGGRAVVNGATALELNLITGRAVRCEETWDASESDAAAASFLSSSRAAYATPMNVKDAADDAMAKMADMLKLGDEGAGGMEDVQVDPNDPMKFFTESNKPEDDYLQYALFVAALWLVYEGLKATATLH